MCGITGFTGRQPALPFLLQGLSKLEYRGYDSAGVTLVNSKKLRTWKTKGRLKELEKLLNRDLEQSCGIGHTRWATHGVPSNMNAHPHMNEDDTISVVHNGIVENYAELKEELKEKGYIFHSETDSEVIVQLLDYYYRQKPVMKDALVKTVKRLEGSYAICVTSILSGEGIGFDSAEGMSPTLVMLQHQCVKGTGSMPATDRSRPEPPFSLSLCFL